MCKRLPGWSLMKRLTWFWWDNLLVKKKVPICGFKIVYVFWESILPGIWFILWLLITGLMKGLRVLGLFVLLVGFPLVSYLYLKAGFNYRKDAIERLSSRIPFDQTPFSEELALLPSELQGHTTLVFQGKGESQEGRALLNIYEQFEAAPGFKIIEVVTGSPEGHRKWTQASRVTQETPRYKPEFILIMPFILQRFTLQIWLPRWLRLMLML